MHSNMTLKELYTRMRSAAIEFPRNGITPHSTGSIYPGTNNSYLFHEGSISEPIQRFSHNNDVWIVNTVPVTVHCDAALLRCGAVFFQSTFHRFPESRNAFAVNNSNDHFQPTRFAFLRLGQINTMRGDNDWDAFGLVFIRVLLQTMKVIHSHVIQLVCFLRDLWQDWSESCRDAFNSLGFHCLLMSDVACNFIQTHGGWNIAGVQTTYQLVHENEKFCPCNCFIFCTSKTVHWVVRPRGPVRPDTLVGEWVCLVRKRIDSWERFGEVKNAGLDPVETYVLNAAETRF